MRGCKWSCDDHEGKGGHDPEVGTWVQFRFSQSSLTLWPCLPCPPPEPASNLEPWSCHALSLENTCKTFSPARCLVRVQKAGEEITACWWPVSRSPRSPHLLFSSCCFLNTPACLSLLPPPIGDVLGFCLHSAGVWVESADSGSGPSLPPLGRGK